MDMDSYITTDRAKEVVVDLKLNLRERERDRESPKYKHGYI